METGKNYYEELSARYWEMLKEAWQEIGALKADVERLKIKINVDSIKA